MDPIVQDAPRPTWPAWRTPKMRRKEFLERRKQQKWTLPDIRGQQKIFPRAEPQSARCCDSGHDEAPSAARWVGVSHTQDGAIRRVYQLLSTVDDVGDAHDDIDTQLQEALLRRSHGQQHGPFTARNHRAYKTTKSPRSTAVEAASTTTPQQLSPLEHLLCHQCRRAEHRPAPRTVRVVKEDAERPEQRPIEPASAIRCGVLQRCCAATMQPRLCQSRLWRVHEAQWG